MIDESPPDYIEIAQQFYKSWISHLDSKFFKSCITVSKEQGRARFNHGYRLLLVIAQLHTLKCLTSGCYFSTESVPLSLDSIQNSTYSTQQLKEIISVPEFNNSPPNFVKKNMDCLDCAIEIINENDTETYFKIAVLNMANENHPGGGYLTGASAQEESLFRRTTLAAALHPKKVKGCRRQQITYPWKKSNIDVIFSDNIEIFKHSSDTGFEVLDCPYNVSIISTAAKNSPTVKEVNQFGDDFAKESDIMFSFNRWLSVFLAAIHHKVTHLIVCPLGCGAFHNPIEAQMSILAYLVSIYHKFFQQITFCTTGNGMERYVEALAKFSPLSASGHPYIPCADLFSKCRKFKDPVHSGKYFHVPTQSPTNFFLNILSDVTTTQTVFLHKKDLEHDLLNCHAPECPEGPQCTNKSLAHRQEVYHRPICNKGRECVDKNCKYQHELVPCSKRNCFDLTMKHQNDFTHLFPLATDPFSSYSGSGRVVCERGYECRNKDDAVHCKEYIHIERPLCPDSNCSLLDEFHLNTFRHQGVKDFRARCRDGSSCPKRYDSAHFRLYSHPPDEQLTVMGALMPNLGRNTKELNYFANYAKLTKIVPTNRLPQNLNHLSDLLLKLRPCHRINTAKFESCLTHGSFYSLHFMKNSVGNPDVIKNTVASSHFKLRSFKHYDQAAIYLKAHTYAKMNQQQQPDPGQSMRLEQDCNRLSSSDKQSLERLALQIATAASNLASIAPPGIAYKVDEYVKTDRTIFSILGPNPNSKYGEIAVLFSSSLTKNPATFLHVTAATMYYNRASRTDYPPHRPYVKLNSDPKNNIKLYHDLIQNLGVKGVSRTLALDLCLMLSNYYNRPGKRGFDFDNVDSRALLNSFFGPDSHYLIECHLPGRVSFNDVEHVVIPKSVYDNFGEATKRELNRINDLKPGFLVTVNGSHDGHEFNNKVTELSISNAEAEYGFNTVLTGHTDHDFVDFMTKITAHDLMCVRFDVNSNSNFSFTVSFQRSLHWCFMFRDGMVQLYDRTDPDVATDPRAFVKMYFPRRCAATFIRFGIKMNMKTGEISAQRIGPEVEFKYDQLYYKSERLPKHNDDVASFSARLHGTQSSSSYASFNKVELGTSEDRLEPKKTWPKIQVPIVIPKATVLPINPRPDAASSVIMCRNPFTCKYYYNGREAETAAGQQHLQRYRHVCRHGQNCRNPSSPDHVHFIHLDLPACRNGSNCNKLGDPQHRFSYSHGEVSIVPYQCKNGKNCKDIRRSTHLKKFGHWDCDKEVCRAPTI
ncbi:hypothetical protein GEMRC1_003570 [Eukaryota sp. GEM-RC1]